MNKAELIADVLEEYGNAVRNSSGIDNSDIRDEVSNIASHLRGDADTLSLDEWRDDLGICVKDDFGAHFHADCFRTCGCGFLKGCSSRGVSA